MNFKELLGKVQGRFDVPAANSEIGSQELREFRTRCSPANMAIVLEAIQMSFDALKRLPPEEPKEGTIAERKAYNDKWSEWNKSQCSAVVHVRAALQALNNPSP